jgi:hypothetical protein
VEAKTRTINRIQKVLEDANIKLASVASDVMGVSCRAMIQPMPREHLRRMKLLKPDSTSLRPFQTQPSQHRHPSSTSIPRTAPTSW